MPYLSNYPNRNIQTPQALRFGKRSMVSRDSWAGQHGKTAILVRNGDDYHTLEPDLTVYDDGSVMDIVQSKPAPTRVNFELARRWIDGAKATHDHCNTLRLELKNLLVVDCDTREIVEAPKNCLYVALSYVWGHPRDCGTLPRTINDSIAATLQLGYQYLWVDKYCINQASAEDKHRQINQMGKIYSMAEVTLIAAAGVDSSYGLPGVNRDRDALEEDVKVGRLRFVTTYELVADEVHKSVWSSRAWTFQEGYMSKRRLYFTDRRILYVCDTHVHYDANWFNKPIGWEDLGSMGQCLPDAISQSNLAVGIMREYTRRNLSYESDALNAIVGTLNTLAGNEPPICHIWGVTFAPSYSLYEWAIALHWNHTSPCPRRHDFPSWSPIGWDGAVEYLPIVQPLVSETFQVKVWERHRYGGLSRMMTDLSRSHSRSDIDRSRYLLVVAKIMWVEFRFISDPYLHQDEDAQAGLYANFPTSESTRKLILPYWDVEKDASFSGMLAPCVIIPGDTGAAYTIIILQNCETHYERIGCFVYLGDSNTLDYTNLASSKIARSESWKFFNYHGRTTNFLLGY